MNNKYLPIGTVVLLEGGTKKVMITGYHICTEDNKDRVFDYRGCPFPEGVLDTKGTALFDADQIVEICHEGWKCDESLDFLDRIEFLIDNEK